MVSLNVVRSSNVALIKSQPLVALFVGGTSGIGEYAVRALVAAQAKDGMGLRLYIVGRNETAAQVIIADCLETYPAGDYRFVQASDLALLNDVDRVCAEIIEAEKKEGESTGKKPRIDFMVQSQALFAFNARKETKEGLDTILSLLYYSRMRFITQLLPLLLASPLPAHVVSVFNPNSDKALFPDDLSLRKPENYGFMNAGSHAAYMTTCFFETLTAQHPGRLSLSHYFPGLVMTPAFVSDSVPVWFKWTFRLLSPIVWLVAVPPVECGDRVLFLASSRFPARDRAATGNTRGGVEVATASDGMVGGGAYRSNWNGETIPLGKGYERVKEEGLFAKFWDHTMKAFDIIESGKVFTE